MEPILEKVHDSGRCCLSFHPSSEYLCIGGFNGFIKQYSYGLNNSSKLSLSNSMDEINSESINEINYCSSGDYFAMCCSDGEVILFRHPDCSIHSLIAKYDCPISSISFLNESHSFLFAISTDNGKIKIVNALDFNQSYFEFNIENCNGIRFIKFINYKPDIFKTSRQKYLGIAQNNGSFCIYKILKLNIFNHKIENINEKFIKINEFPNIFPKIKGNDLNQRLEFDCTKNGNLIAISGNKNVKILSTESMKFISECETMSHNFNTNCCSFNDFFECDLNNYILATSDINGNLFIWNISYNNNIFKFEIINKIKYNFGICNLVWKNKTELFISTMNSDIYKYTLELNNHNENEINNENKEEENIKKDNNNLSDEDFDIDMNNDETIQTKKLFRQRTFEDSESDNENKLMENKNTNNTNNNILQSELAAAAEMFGDMTEEIGKNKQELFEEEQNDILMDDNGDDLKDFIINDNNNNNNKNENDMIDENEIDNMSEINNENENENEFKIEINETKPFINGETEFFSDGQKYLLMNKIGAIIIRKQEILQNEMDKNKHNNSIINVLNNGKYYIEIDFFDKLKYSRAISIKTDHFFICCDMNCNGLLLGSKPIDGEMNESIIKYKSIKKQNNIYRNFLSEKDCEWTYILPNNEIVICVGLTFKYAIIITNQRYLRILSIGGIQLHNIISLPKNVINIACNQSNNSNQNIIAITFNDYSLWILDLDNNNNILYNGYCPITNNQCKITRVFMIENKLITIDSNGIVRLLCNNNWIWIVILDINLYVNQKYLNDKPKCVWPIYFDIEEMCLMVMELKYISYPIPCENNNSYILNEYKLFQPLLNMSNMNENNTNKLFGNFEQEIMTKSIEYKLNNQNNKNYKKQLLKEYIQLFNNACKNNKQILAYDIAAHFLNTEKALSNAIKIAMHNQLPLLAEQLTNLTKEKIENKNMNNKNKNKKQIRSLGKLKRPIAKLNTKKILQNNINNINNINNNNNKGNDICTQMQRTQMIGKKRPNNPCPINNKSIQQPPMKKGRNPFSFNDNKNNNDKKNNNNSIFTV